MSITLTRPMSQETFFAWAEAQEERYEFDGEQPVLVTGGNILHSKLMGRLLARLLAQVDGVTFEAVGPDAAVATIGNRIRYPDVVVGAGSSSIMAKVVQSPVAVFEIVSASSSRTDRITKLREYGAVPSIRYYIILETDSAAATLFNKRVEGDWIAVALTKDEVISLPELAITVPIGTVYQGLID